MYILQYISRRDEMLVIDSKSGHVVKVYKGQDSKILAASFAAKHNEKELMA